MRHSSLAGWIDAFMGKFGRVDDFEGNSDYATWTFWSYARKAGDIFGSIGQPIFLQLKGQRARVARLLKLEVASAMSSNSS